MSSRSFRAVVSCAVVGPVLLASLASLGRADDDAVLTRPLPAPVFSPFGEHVVAAVGGEGHGAILVVGLAAKPPTVKVVTELAVDPAGAHPRWSADGSRVAWSVGAAAMVATPGKDGKPEKRPLGEAIADYDPTSDWAVVANAVYAGGGEHVAFVIPRGKGKGTWVAPLVGGKTTRLAGEPARAIAWSRDGARLAIAVPEGIFTIGADGKDKQGIALQADDGGPIALRFAADGESLLAFSGKRLRAYPLAGRGEGTPIGEEVAAAAVAFSPTKDWLAVVTSKGGLALLDAAGGKLEPVTARDARVLSAPSWSADGAKIAVLEFGGPGEVALTVHEVEGGGGAEIPLFWNPTKRDGGKKR